MMSKLLKRERTMSKVLFSIAGTISFFLLSCTDAEEKISYKNVETTAQKPQSVPIILHGQWKTEGNEGVISSWLEFDSTNMEFYKWLTDEEKPSVSSGNYEVKSDSILELSYSAYNERQQFVLDSFSQNYIDLYSLGISAGNLIYNRTTYIQADSPKNYVDTISITGTLIAINESDFWGRIYLTIDIEGEKQTYDYYNFDFPDLEPIEKLLDKKVDVEYYTEVTLQEIDFHPNGESIHGEYAAIKTDEDRKSAEQFKIIGTLSIDKDNIGGDLPGDYLITENDGTEHEITAFTYQEYVQFNNKVVSVYCAENYTEIATSINGVEAAESDGMFSGSWKKEDTNNPIDPTSILIKKNEEGLYKVKFSNENYFVNAKLSSNVLKGKSNSGNFTIEVVSKNPTILEYSDDGRGHFEPVKNEHFILVK